MKTLLVIGYVWPEPNSSAAGSRMLQLLAAFQQGGYRVVFGSPAEQSSHAVNLASYAIEAVSLPLNDSAFDQYIEQLQPDAVLFDRFMMEEQFGWRVEKQCPQALRLLDTEDLHCLRHARHQAFKEQQPLSERHYFSDLAKREIAAILRCDLSLMISEFEMEWLQRIYQVPAALLHYSPFMVTPTPADIPAMQEREHFIAIGNFRHEPNWDAVLYLQQLWPSIRRQLPRAQLLIYGAYPPPKATQLHNPKQGFLVCGWAEDALTVVRQARVMLAPLRFGAGLKGKLLDAAQCGTPAVTTSLGAEGMYGAAPAATVADGDEAFIAAAVAVYQSPPLWQQLSDRAVALIPERFSAAHHQPLLMARVEACHNELAAHRLRNFYGAMLRHHHLKSTQYMAQWIEVKQQLAQLKEDCANRPLP